MQVLVVQDVESIHPILMPLLRFDLRHQGLGRSVLLGDKLVDYSPSFKLILATRNAAIALPPDMQPLLTVVNFAVTRAALEVQLLTQTMQHERPELESQRRCSLTGTSTIVQ